MPTSEYAVSNPIYFEAAGYRATEPAQAQVELEVIDSASGQPLDGGYEIVQQMIGRVPKTIASGTVAAGRATLAASPTARIRGRAAGKQESMKGIFVDTPDLLNATIEIQPEGF